jgi:SAM-dependent methyltransferase
LINVLQDWGEVGDSILSIQRRGLPLHSTAQKNWDHALLLNALTPLSHDSAIIDLGCDEGLTLNFLRAAGYENLYGLDLNISWRARAAQLVRMWRRRSLKPPYHLGRASITQTPFEAGRFAAALSISTIEHGVDKPAFLREAARILKPGGLLFVTTDYWQERIRVSESFRAYGQRWEIACCDDIAQFLKSAAAVGLSPRSGCEIPACSQRTVHWGDADYTFIAMIFRKDDGATRERASL